MTEWLQSKCFPSGYEHFFPHPCAEAITWHPDCYKEHKYVRVRRCVTSAVWRCADLSSSALFLNSLSPGVLKLPYGKFFLGKSCTSYFSFLSRFYFWLRAANLLPASWYDLIGFCFLNDLKKLKKGERRQSDGASVEFKNLIFLLIYLLFMLFYYFSSISLSYILWKTKYHIDQHYWIF